MKRKIFLLFAIMSMLVFALALTSGAKSVYLEPIPEELKAENDTFTHFVVFEEPKYFISSGNTISGLNGDEMNNDMDAAGSAIDKSKIGTEYLTRFNFPEYIGENLITYVNLNSIKSHMYFKNVCGYIQLEGTVNKVHDMNECISQLRCIDFGENSQVTAIPYCFANNGTRLASVKNLPRNLTYVGDRAFDRCFGAFEGELYVDAETIGSSAFNNAISNVTHIILGPNVKSIGTQAFTVLFETQHHNEIPLYYAPSDVKPALVSIEFQCDVSQVSFARQASNSGAFFFPVATGRAPYEKLTTIILSHPSNAKYVTEGSVFNDFTADGITILFNDANGLDDFVTAKHDFSIFAGITYDDFSKPGVKITVCSKCGAENGESTASLFTCLGYSASESGACGIVIGYTVNKAAVAEYEAATSISLEYGVFVGLKSTIGNNELFAEDGTAISGVIYAKLAYLKFSVFELKIVGFNDNQKDIKLALGAYVKETDGEEIRYSYMQNDAPENNDKYSFVSYNDILNSRQS